jgi:hypothetical protein
LPCFPRKIIAPELNSFADSIAAVLDLAVIFYRWTDAVAPTKAVLLNANAVRFCVGSYAPTVLRTGLTSVPIAIALFVACF